jgi:hypothetical protein
LIDADCAHRIHPGVLNAIAAISVPQGFLKSILWSERLNYLSYMLFADWSPGLRGRMRETAGEQNQQCADDWRARVMRAATSL